MKGKHKMKSIIKDPVLKIFAAILMVGVIFFFAYTVETKIYTLTVSQHGEVYTIANANFELEDEDLLRKEDKLLLVKYNWKAGVWAEGISNVLVDPFKFREIEAKYSSGPRSIASIDTVCIKEISLKINTRKLYENQTIQREVAVQ